MASTETKHGAPTVDAAFEQVEHRGWTDEAYARVIEHALAGALSH